jgi:hypothetical protein
MPLAKVWVALAKFSYSGSSEFTIKHVPAAVHGA